MRKPNHLVIRLPRTHGPDYILALTVFALCLIGIVMIFSASVVNSYNATDGTTTTKFLYHQILSLTVGIVFGVMAYKIDFPIWRKWGPKIFGLMVFVLLLVLITGSVAGGAQRWINVFGVFTFQPTEAIKLAFILYLAYWLEKRTLKVNNKEVILPFVLMLIGVSVLILLQPNLSTTLIITASAMAIYFVAGANWKILGSLMASGIAAVWILIKLESYRLNRLFCFLNPEANPEGLCYQINQALIAVSNGGLFGVGFNQSRQKYLYLPEVTTDAIFPIIAEELGFFRALAILILYLLLVVRGFKVAKNAPDEFSRFIVVGITAWFLVQVFINVGAMMSIVPLTGVPLIFISFGGSSLLFSLIAVGVLLNISKYTKEEVVYANYGGWRGNWRTYLSYFGGSRKARRKGH